jgi:hypothetical protein
VIEGARPDHARLPGVPLAPPMFVNFNKALTPRDLEAVVAYLRSVKPLRNEVPTPDYKKPFGRVPIRTPRGYTLRMRSKIPSHAAPTSLPLPLHGVSLVPHQWSTELHDRVGERRQTL